MWEGSYASEPFDLRLTMLRMIRNLGWIVLFALLGTILFGGGYYVKNVLLGERARYEQTITCKMEYTNPPVQSGDYYINEMTWNTYLDSEDFRRMLENAVPFAAMDVTPDMWTETPGGVAGALSAAVASDIHVPSVTVSTPSAEKTEVLCDAVQEILTGVFAESIPEVASIRVIDVSDVRRVLPDKRPLRAFVLSALLSCFFAVVFLLLREIGADSIWLPATLRRRYGLKPLGTVQSAELCENARFLFKNIHNIAVCAIDDQIVPQDVTKSLQDILQNEEKDRRVWTAVPSPFLSPEAAAVLRQAEGVLLVVEAGLHAGKPLERALEYFAVQEVSVTAVLLWNADEALIRSYYRMERHRGGILQRRQKCAENCGESK